MFKELDEKWENLKLNLFTLQRLPQLVANMTLRLQKLEASLQLLDRLIGALAEHGNIDLAGLNRIIELQNQRAKFPKLTLLDGGKMFELRSTDNPAEVPDDPKAN